MASLKEHGGEAFSPARWWKGEERQAFRGAQST